MSGLRAQSCPVMPRCSVTPHLHMNWIYNPRYNFHVSNHFNTYDLNRTEKLGAGVQKVCKYVFCIFRKFIYIDSKYLALRNVMGTNVKLIPQFPN